MSFSVLEKKNDVQYRLQTAHVNYRMHTYIHIYIHKYTYMHTHIHTHTHIYIYIYIFIYLFLLQYMFLKKIQAPTIIYNNYITCTKHKLLQIHHKIN